MSWGTIRGAIQRINRGLCFAGMFLLLPMMLMTAVDVAGRAFWRFPIPGAVELSSYMLAVFVLTGVAYTHQVRGHVRVSLLTSRLPRGAALVLNLITTSLSLFITVVVFWQGCVIAARASSVSDMLRIPQWPFRYLVALGAFLLCLELVIEFVDTLEELRRR